MTKSAADFYISHNGNLGFSFNFSQEQNYKSLEICNSQTCNEINNETTFKYFENVYFGSNEIFYIKTYGYCNESQKSQNRPVLIGIHKYNF